MILMASMLLRLNSQKKPSEGDSDLQNQQQVQDVFRGKPRLGDTAAAA